MSLTLVITGAANGRQLTKFGPKPLWMASDHETVFDCQLKVLNREATERPIVVGGFESDKLREGVGHIAKVVENPQWEQLGCACSAQVGTYHARPGRVLIAHGDVLFSTFTIPPSGSWLILTDTPGRGCGEVGVTQEGGWAVNMEYGLKPRWAQAVVMDLRERELFQDLSLRRELLYEAINATIDRGGRYSVCHPSGLQIHDIDKKAELIAAKPFRKKYVP